MKKIDLSEYEKKLVLRNLHIEDFDDYKELHHKCFPKIEPMEKEHLQSQLEIFPEGQFVIECESKVIASASSLIVDLDEYADYHNWDDIAGEGYITTHDPDGDTLYGIEIMVDPGFRGMKLSRRLYDARKQLCRDLNLKRIVIGGRIPGYQKYQAKISAREYVERVIDRAEFDPVLTPQISAGFVLKRLLQDYLWEDDESSGWATLLEWSNLDFKPSYVKRTMTAIPVRIGVAQYRMRPIKSFDDFRTQCEYFIDVASDYKSDFLLFPEIFTTQLLSFVETKSPAESVRKLTEFTPQYLELFSEMSVKYNINIIGGSHFILENEKIYNVSYLFHRNGEIDKQYKIHVTPNERFWWGIQPGDMINVFKTDRGRIAILICYDIEFPELCRIAVEKGARILFVPFSTNERHGYMRVRYCAQARCIENQVYAAIAGTTGNLPFVDNMDTQYAQSGIYTPSDMEFARDGIAAECNPNIETVVVHDVDLAVLERYRKDGSVLNWQDRRKDIYEIVYDKNK
ncbi:GNAT family N-acetyltransferase [candidate division KSB1 bacterium]|nr:GNAT family N-acetyltransferase [candidate division KSB1 bacterium]